MNDEEFAAIAKAVADPTRLQILSQIAQSSGDYACANFKECLDVTPATISHHAKELVCLNLIETRREGKFQFYRLNRKRWREYLAELQRRVPKDKK